MKKAAMFGLDARIALAIFGALSVISGAALYSAIAKANATSLVQELREVGKAWEQYYLDTGQQLSFDSTDSSNGQFHRARVIDLVEDPGVKGWNGPYLSYSVVSNDKLEHYKYNFVYMFAFNNKNDWGSAESYNNGYCAAGDECSIWVYITNLTDYAPALHESIDELVDGGDGSYDGNIKWTGNGSNIIYKVAPIKNRL
tara:strand:- start:1242 stop:1838 length:597 start_codon:yes stop_codon:yes gene_type:complete